MPLILRTPPRVWPHRGRLGQAATNGNGNGGQAPPVIQITAPMPGPSAGISQPWKNPWTIAQFTQQPTGYNSPLQAINANLPRGQSWAAWRALVNSYSSPASAINAGVPAGVVNALWQTGPGKPVPWAEQKSLFGIANGVLLSIGIGLVALAAWSAPRGGEFK
jgi:hypothetical protein